MDRIVRDALVKGVERVAAWCDLLDDINVFPVADGDTGRNLMTSLSPLRRLDGDSENMVRRLLFSARGNSGNIAALFLSGLLTSRSVKDLPAASRTGRDRAWQGITDPVPGTMLDVLDALERGDFPDVRVIAFDTIFVSFFYFLHGLTQDRSPGKRGVTCQHSIPGQT